MGNFTSQIQQAFVGNSTAEEADGKPSKGTKSSSSVSKKEPPKKRTRGSERVATRAKKQRRTSAPKKKQTPQPQPKPTPAKKPVRDSSGRFSAKKSATKSKKKEPKKKGSASADKIERDRKWMEMYERLVEYKNEYGDCRVPSSYAYDGQPQLSGWVRTQRRFCKDEDRIKLLDELDFTWDARQKAK